MFPAGLKPATFRVLGGRDNHYVTETWVNLYGWIYLVIFSSENIKQGHKHCHTFLIWRRKAITKKLYRNAKGRMGKLLSMNMQEIMTAIQTF